MGNSLYNVLLCKLSTFFLLLEVSWYDVSISVDIFISMCVFFLHIGETETTFTTSSLEEAEQSGSKSAQSATSSSSTVPVITGVVVGLVAIAAISAIAIFVFRKRRAKEEQMDDLTGADPAGS